MFYHSLYSIFCRVGYCFYSISSNLYNPSTNSNM
nr:MAG TPA: hypothetical protein [Caudoviricetes sp.]